MDFKLFGNSLLIVSRLMDSNNCFSKVIAHVFPLWHGANTHLKTPQRQTVKSPAFFGGARTS